MPRALVLGGSGVLGTAVARRLLVAGWDVELAGREPAHLPVELADAGARFVTAERSDPDQLRSALGNGADLLVDCLCYTAAGATMLLPLLGDVTSTVMVSSKAVYVDQFGNHSNSTVEPHFAAPVNETQATLAPRSDVDFDTAEGYGANKVAAEQVLLDSGRPVSVLRASRSTAPGRARRGSGISSSGRSTSVLRCSSPDAAPVSTTRQLLQTSPHLSSLWHTCPARAS